MGITDALPNADAQFAELYEQADKLRYDAKFSGRNRTKTALAHSPKNDADPVFDTAAIA